MEDMKTFSTELTKMLCEAFHIKEDIEIPVVTYEEYKQTADDYTKSLFSYGGSNYWTGGFFDYHLGVAVIADIGRYNPLTYSEEIAHGLRSKTYKVENFWDRSRTVDEFFGRLGANQMLFYRQTHAQDFPDQLPTSIKPEDVKELWSRKKKCESKLASLENEFFEPHDVLPSDVKRDLEELAALFPGEVHVPRGYDQITKEKRAAESELNHMIGYTVADIVFEIAKKDKKLFYRTDEEIEEIYFKPVMRYDWSTYSPDDPAWCDINDKINHEIEQMLEGN
jgi:hypothetical protein